MPGHDDFVRVVHGLANNKISSGSRDNTLRLWDLASATCEGFMKGHGLPIWAIC